MTILEIILIIALIFLLGAHVMNFISVACGCYLCEFEDLICNLLWVIFLPIALVRRFIFKK